VGKEQYADIIEIARNVLILIVESAIPVGQKGPDQDMTEDSIESICLGEIKRVMESVKGWKLLETDFSSIAL
jgi:hypothetical protein